MAITSTTIRYIKKIIFFTIFPRSVCHKQKKKDMGSRTRNHMVWVEKKNKYSNSLLKNRLVFFFFSQREINLGHSFCLSLTPYYPGYVYHAPAVREGDKLPHPLFFTSKNFVKFSCKLFLEPSPFY